MQAAIVSAPSFGENLDVTSEVMPHCCASQPQFSNSLYGKVLNGVRQGSAPGDGIIYDAQLDKTSQEREITNMGLGWRNSLWLEMSRSALGMAHLLKQSSLVMALMAIVQQVEGGGLVGSVACLPLSVCH